MTESEITHSSDNASHHSLKSDGEHIEKSNTTHTGDIEHAGTHITGAAHLTQDHREYLLARYGTLDLDPIPGPSDADPYNWPRWKKIANLVLVAFHACMATFNAASIIPAYGEIAEEFETSITRASYLTSLQIAILGGAPLLWKPVSSRYGRRPIFLLSLICSLAGNIGCAKSPTYATTAVCRAITAFFISPASAIGSGVVTETFFKKERAKYMGVWTLMITLGIPIGPFIFGFVTYHVGFRWIYWVLAITHGVQFILYLFLGPETRYLRRGIEHEGSVFKQEYVSLKRIDPQPFTFYEFIEPLVLMKYPSIAIAACAYAMIFVFGSVLMTVEIPTLFIEKFEFNPQQLGLQFIGIIIGSVIGEQIGGRLSDFWMSRGTKKRGTRPEPEYRLWLSYSGFILAIVGVIVFLVQTAFAEEGHWNVTPIVGAAIGAAGNQIVTTVLVTYAVDCFPDKSSAVGVTITFVRQIWGFIGPFWFPPMFEQVGIAESAGVTTALMVGVSVIPTIFVQWQGQKWRARWNPAE